MSFLHYPIETQGPGSRKTRHMNWVPPLNHDDVIAGVVHGGNIELTLHSV